MSAPDARATRGAAAAVAAPRLHGKRVVIVLEGLELAGAERQALLLARHLRSNEEADVEVWTLSKPGRGARWCEELGIPWRLVRVNQRWTAATLPRAIVGMAFRLRHARADVVLPFTLVPNLLCCAAAPIHGATTIWNQRDAGIDRVSRRLERFAVRRADEVISNSRAGAKYLEAELGAVRVRIVPNGVEVPYPVPERAAARAALGLPDGAFVACMVAHLTKSKDHATLLRAFRLVVERSPANPPWLLLAGRKDDAYSDLVDLARTLAIEERVRFLGEVEDVSGLLAGVDLGVHSSRLEGCPNGVLECMAAALAVAGTDNDGIRDVVGGEGARFLAAPGDAGALADCILLAASDRELRDRLGAANRERVRRDFSVEAMCASMTALIATAGAASWA